MEHKNLHSYNNYEIFDDKIIEDSYKISKLKSSDCHVNFIEKIFKRKNLRVVELGSGNSKTLFNLSLKNILNHGFGFEISNTRHSFAETWKNELGIKNVTNVLDNFLSLGNYNISDVDLFFLSDLSFQFCEPISVGAEKKLLSRIYNDLNDDGKLILELDGCGKVISSIDLNSKIWEEFDINDPWQFSLWNCNYDKKTNFLNWDKTFISRRGDKRDFTSVTLKIYNKEEIEKLLVETGFKKINFYQNWDFDSFKSDKSEFIVLAEKF